MAKDEKNILILCANYPFATDTAFGYYVFKALEKMQMPENVELMEIGEAASEIPHIIEGKDKLIIIDVFRTKDELGTILRFGAFGLVFNNLFILSTFLPFCPFCLYPYFLRFQLHPATFFLH